MGMNWQKYEHINSIVQHDDKYLSTALDNNVYWEIKRDGSNISIQYHKGFMVVHTRNQVANSHVQGEVKGLIKDFEPTLKKLLEDRYIAYFELIRAGHSPAQFEMHDKPSIIAIDLWDIQNEMFVHPALRYQLFEDYGIPHIPCFITAKYKTRKEFEEDTDTFIEIAVRLQIEGFVAKWVGEKDNLLRKIKAKVEHKYPRQVKEGKKTRNQRTRLPDLDVSEVRGAIDKVYMDLSGEDFRDKKIVMPLIAKAVAEEGRKHKAQNRINLYAEYLDFLRGLR